MRLKALALTVLAGCDPYGHWPDPHTVFPWVYTPETGLEPWEEVRWETETWTPGVDQQQTLDYVTKAFQHRRGAPIESLQHFGMLRSQIPTPVPGDLTLSFVGDVMWTGGGWGQLYDRVEPLLEGDLRIGNLETPTSPDHPTGLGDLGPYAFNAPPELLDGLPLDIVQLNNNHTLDAGDEGLQATLAELQERDLVAVGVDGQVLVNTGGPWVALLSYTWGLNDPSIHTEHELFVVPFGQVGTRVDLRSVRDGIDAAHDTGADLVVVLVHWGFEYEYYADPHFLVLGRRLLSAGADLVVGTGPHVVQPPEICAVNAPKVVPRIGTCSIRSPDGRGRTGAILYSLGNFGTFQPTLPVQVGMVAHVSLRSGVGVTGIDWSAVATVQEDGVPAVVPLEDLVEDPVYAEEAERLDQHLGTGWRR